MNRAIAKKLIKIATTEGPRAPTTSNVLDLARAAAIVDDEELVNAVLKLVDEHVETATAQRGQIGELTALAEANQILDRLVAKQLERERVAAL